MSLSMENARTMPIPPPTSRGWISEVSAITGSVLSQPLLTTANEIPDVAIERCRRKFLAWLLVGHDGQSGAQVAETVTLSRAHFPMLANLIGQIQPVQGVLANHLSIIEGLLGQRQLTADLQREELRKSDKSIEQAHGALLHLCQEYASICALEVAEGVISSQTSWEKGAFQGSGHTLAEAILAYTSTRAYWAAALFWSSANLNGSYVQIYSDTFQTKLHRNGGQRSLGLTLDAHEEALDVVRMIARREAALTVEGLLKE